MLLSAQGAKYHNGAFDWTVPCLKRHIMAATMIAKNLFENTQNVALGNFPEGFLGVGWRVEFIINSCMMPHTKYETCKPKNANTKSNKSFDGGDLLLVPTFDRSGVCSFFVFDMAVSTC